MFGFSKEGLNDLDLSHLVFEIRLVLLEVFDKVIRRPFSFFFFLFFFFNVIRRPCILRES